MALAWFSVLSFYLVSPLAWIYRKRKIFSKSFEGSREIAVGLVDDDVEEEEYAVQDYNDECALKFRMFHHVRTQNRDNKQDNANASRNIKKHNYRFLMTSPRQRCIRVCAACTRLRVVFNFHRTHSIIVSLISLHRFHTRTIFDHIKVALYAAANTFSRNWTIEASKNAKRKENQNYLFSRRLSTSLAFELCNRKNSEKSGEFHVRVSIAMSICKWFVGVQWTSDDRIETNEVHFVRKILLCVCFLFDQKCKYSNVRFAHILRFSFTLC